jgi:hypothetical protein
MDDSGGILNRLPLPFERDQRPVVFLPLEGVPASLGPGLRTESGAVRSLGEKLSPSARMTAGGRQKAVDAHRVTGTDPNLAQRDAHSIGPLVENTALNQTDRTKSSKHHDGP